MAENQQVEVGHIVARLLAVALPMGLVLDEVLVEGESLQLQTDPFRVTISEPGSLEVRVSQVSLAAFLESRAPGGLKDFKVVIADGLIHVEAKASIIISISVGAVCRIVIQNGTHLVVELVRMEAIGGTGAANLVQKQLDNINPVIRAEDLPVRAQFTKVVAVDGWLAIFGTVAPAAE